MGSIAKRFPPLMSMGLNAEQYKRVKQGRKQTIAELVAVSESNLKRTGAARTPTLRAFSWQPGFATNENLSVIAGLASMCKRGNMYDKIGNGALKHQS